MNKLKFLSWFALTVFSATAMWAADTQGSWTRTGYRTGTCDIGQNNSISYDNNEYILQTAK